MADLLSDSDVMGSDTPAGGPRLLSDADVTGGSPSNTSTPPSVSAGAAVPKRSLNEALPTAAAAHSEEHGMGKRIADIANAIGNNLAFGPMGIAVNAGAIVDPDLRDIGAKAIKAAPADAVEIVKGMYHAIRHFPETVTTLGKLADAILSQTEDPEMRGAIARSSPETQKAYNEALEAHRAETKPILDAALKGLQERYGGYAELKNAIATKPLSVASDMSIFLPMAAPANLGARGAAGAARLAEPVVSHALGATTGAGVDSVRAAARAGFEGGEANEVFKGQMRGARDMNEPVDLAKSAVGGMKEERSAAYKKGMSGLSTDKTVLDLDPIAKSVDDASAIGSFNGVPYSKAAAETQSAIKTLVDGWKNLDPAVLLPSDKIAEMKKAGTFDDWVATTLTPENFHSAEGLDALKKAVGEIRMTTEPGTQSRIIADSVYNSIKDQIVKQAPAYAETMADYQKASEGVRDATKTMSLGEKTSSDTALRKLQSTMRDSVASNFGARKKIGEALAEHEPTLPFAIAGQTLASPLPRGLTARGLAIAEGAGHATTGGATLPLLAASSPRLVGEVANAAGSMAGMVNRAWEAVSPIVDKIASPLFEAGNADQQLRKAQGQ